MSKIIQINSKVFLALLFFAWNTFSFGQVFGELLPGSSALVYDANKGVHKLLDGANFIYQGNTMYCDSAYYFESNKTIRAYGNVHIQKNDNVSLFCDSLLYRTNNGVATLWGKVRAIDEQYRVTTDSMDYNTRTQQGVYRQGGKIENLTKKEVLTSKIGYFYPNAKNFFFRTNVVYDSDELYMTTDSLKFEYLKDVVYFYGPSQIFTEDATLCGNQGWYNLKTEEGSLMRSAEILQEARIIKGDTLLYSPANRIAEGFGNVYVLDTIDRMAFSSHYALMNDSLKFSLLTKDAMAIKYQKDDTIYIHADTLYNQNDSLNKRIQTLAYHGVRIFGNSIQGRGDSLSFSKDDGYMELYKKPILWSQNGELKGDSMRVYMNDSIIEYAKIWGKATAVMEVDGGQYFNQVGGNEMNAYFKDNEVYLAKVIGNAQTIFYPTEAVKTIVDGDSLDAAMLFNKTRLQVDSLIAALAIDSIAGVDFSKIDEIPDSLEREQMQQLLIAKTELERQISLRTISDSTLISSDSLVKDSTKLRELVTIKRMGLNRFFASQIKVYFDSGEVVGVTYYDQPDGVFYPMDKIVADEKYIANFATNFALKPKSVEDLLNEE